MLARNTESLLLLLLLLLLSDKAFQKLSQKPPAVHKHENKERVQLIEKVNRIG